MGTARRVFKWTTWVLSLLYPLMFSLSWLVGILDFGEYPTPSEIDHILIGSFLWFITIWFFYGVFLIFFVWPWEKEGTTKSDTAHEPSDTKGK